MAIGHVGRHILPTNQTRNLSPTNSLKSGNVEASYQFRSGNLGLLLLFVDNSLHRIMGEWIVDNVERFPEDRVLVELVVLLENCTKKAC